MLRCEHASHVQTVSGSLEGIAENRDGKHLNKLACAGTGAQLGCRNIRRDSGSTIPASLFDMDRSCPARWSPACKPRKVKIAAGQKSIESDNSIGKGKPE